MINRLDITDEYSVKCDFNLNTVTFIDAALNICENVMFYDFIYLAKGFRMRPKLRSTLRSKNIAPTIFPKPIVYKFNQCSLTRMLFPKA